MRAYCAVGLLVVLAALPAAAGEAGPRWEDLSDREREQVRRNFEEYQRLPDARREFIERRYDRYRDLPPGEQRKLRQNYDRYRGLDANERDRFHQQYREWKSKRKQRAPSKKR